MLAFFGIGGLRGADVAHAAAIFCDPAANGRGVAEIAVDGFQFGDFTDKVRSDAKEKQWLNDESKTEPRAAFAQWITDEKQGAGNLLARVLVNRIWKQHMGQGLVSSVSNFGKTGEPPTHPELLEFESRSVRLELKGEYTRGMTVVDQRTTRRRHEPNVEVAYRIDAERAMQLVMASIGTTV